MPVFNSPLNPQRNDILVWFCKVWLTVFIFLCLTVAAFAQCPETMAYSGTNGTGNQAYDERLGLNFTSSASFTVTQLAAFDSDQNGLVLPITVGIVRDDVPGTVVVLPITFSGSADPLVGNYRVRNITPVTLPAGSYIIVAVGYGSGEPNGNSNIGGHPVVNTNGGGLLTFTNSSYGGVGFGKPDFTFSTPGAFHSGSFSFVVDNTPPTITCPGNITMDTDADRCSAVVCFQVLATDNCVPFLPTTLAGHNYLGTFGGHTYFASTTATSWEVANNAATALGGHLLSINSAIEQATLSGLIPNGPLQQFFIGLRYSPSLDLFKWTSGEPVTYTNWGIGQPNTGILSSDYVFHWDSSLPGLRKWYNTLSIIPRRYIVEFEGFPVTMISGIASGSNFPASVTTNVYSTTDIAGNTATCTFTVTVEDNEAPIITCPDDIEITAEPLACEATIEYDTVEINNATDNCGVAEIELVEGLDTDEDFPLGETEVVWQVTDRAGNSSICSFIVTVNDYINPNLACQPIQLSLDANCEATITPLMVLTGYLDDEDVLLGCLDNFEINILSATGLPLGNTADVSLLNKSLRYSITNPYGFSCWNNVKIEDKIAPEVDCQDATVVCLTDLSTVAIPVPDDNCSSATLLLNESFESRDCDTVIMGVLTRVWQAKDLAGNVSAPCTSLVTLTRSTIAGITPPRPFTLRCSDVYDKDATGNPLPSVSGMPRLSGAPLYPTSNLTMQYCNATIEYKDQLEVNTICKKIILRTWRILEWRCGGLVESFINVQRISIIDDVAPVIAAQADLTFTTKTASCSSSVVLPKLTVTDNCNTISRYIVNVRTASGLPAGNLTTNGGTLELATGMFTVEYVVFDACNNSSTRTFIVTVQDNTDPIAVCDQFNTVNIGNGSITDITAASINNQSYDECTPVVVKIRRMDDPCGGGFDTAWYDKVEFCCLDAGTSPMVQLLVTDAGGNTNMCMVSVIVQDKTTARISCPNDTIVENCTYGFDANIANTTFGSPRIIDNCPATNNFSEIIKDNRNNCGVGTIIRTFTLRPAVPAFGTCVQTITFENNEPFFISNNVNDPNDDVVWPRDYVFTGICTTGSFLPETLPDSSARPIFTEDVCDIVGVKYDDRRSPSTDRGCFKIIRTWKVIDWCQLDKSGEPIVWSYEQEIIIMDNRVPTITSAITKREVRTLDDQCLAARIVLRASATDCTPQADLVWSYVITKGTTFITSGVGNDATDTFPIGLYHIRFEVADQCGNISSTEYDFEIISIKAPTAKCRDIVVNLARNGAIIEKTITPSDLNLNSEHVCGLSVTAAFSANGLIQSRTFTCADRNTTVVVPLFINAPNGTSSTCNARVTIQDLTNLCTTPPNLVANIGGTINSESGATFENIEVTLKGSEEPKVATNDKGYYAFSQMLTNQDYAVIPAKDGDDINGVSTIDLLMIQRHVLGLERLKSPYQMIAADIDHNNKITASDLTELRKLILGIHAGYENNTSWRFIDKNYSFVEPTDPWLSAFPESYNIESLNRDMDIDFIGVKIGDINNNAKTNVDQQITARTSTSVWSEDRMLNIGDIIEVPVYADQDLTLYGLQSSWFAPKMNILKVTPSTLEIQSQEIFIANNTLAISHTISDGIKIKSKDILFTVQLEANRSGRLSEMFTMSTQAVNEIYVDNIETEDLTQNWRTVSQGFKLLNANPNPWITSTNIEFDVPSDGDAVLNVYDLAGKHYVTNSMFANQGLNAFRLTKNEVGSTGVYIYEISFGGQKLTGKMILMD